MCVLDGLERLDIHSLLSLKRFFQDGVVDLPNGERLSVYDSGQSKHSSFRILALSLLPPRATNMEDSRMRWVTSDLGCTYHFLPETSSFENFCNVLERQKKMFTTTDAALNEEATVIENLLSKTLNHLLIASGIVPIKGLHCLVTIPVLSRTAQLT